MVDQAEIHRKVTGGDARERREALQQLRNNFADLPDKDAAWKDLIQLTQDEDSSVRRGAADTLGLAYPQIPDKKQAWKDLQGLAKDEHWYVRVSANHSLDGASIFKATETDNEEKFNAVNFVKNRIPDLNFFITEKEPSPVWREREELVGQLCNNFINVPDKEQAYEDLRGFAQNESLLVRRNAVSALGYVFEHIPDKNHAWKFLCRRLVRDKAESVQRSIANVLDSVFPHIPDKKQAWSDLHGLTTYDGGIVVRRLMTGILSTIFPLIPDQKQAWEDLHWLTQSEDRTVQRLAAYALGHNFSQIPDRKRAWEDLQRLAKDKHWYVRTYANHSLGRASIFKATETESEKEFRKEMKNAIVFFEMSSKEATSFRNPSSFCLPFYRSFYTVTFEKEGAKDEVKRSLSEAKRASEGSENKETLLKAIENLASALTEAQKVTDFDATNLKAYMQYCHSAADMIGAAEGGTPGAALVLRRGLPIIDQRIKELLEEVKKKSESICKVADIPESELACKIERNATAALATDNPIIVDQLIDHIITEYTMRISSIANEDDKDIVRRSVIDAKNKDMAGKLLIIIRLMGVSPPFSKVGGKDMSKYEIKNSLVNIAEGSRINQNIQPHTNSQEDLSQNNSKVHEPSKQQKNKTIPHLSYLESVIYDIFKSVYQKEREDGASEVNSKTLELLKKKLLDLTSSGKEIDWLDVGCGDGRCLEVLDAIQNRDNIRYHGIDNMHQYLDKAEESARGYGINATVDKTNAAIMDFDSEYDVISAVLLLHEVDPLCLPYVLRNMLKALKDDGILVISDFQVPYEQEKNVVVWSADNIENLLENIGVTWIKTQFIPSKQYPEELGFYRCRIKKPRLDNERFDKLLQGYNDFLTTKKEESKQERNKLRVQIEERVRKLLNRPNIDLKNLSEDEMQRIRNDIEPEYGIKAYKVSLLMSQIEFLDDKIEEFNNGTRCAGAD